MGKPKWKVGETKKRKRKINGKIRSCWVKKLSKGKERVKVIKTR